VSRLDARLKALEASAPPMVLVTTGSVTQAAIALREGKPLPQGWDKIFSEDQIRRMAEICSVKAHPGA
jgi:dTDP-4-dehydrorhamnose 3,5-epimerase-like enzyme